MNRTALILAAALLLSAGAMVLMKASAAPTRSPVGCSFDESEYLQLNPDVARAVVRQEFSSGWAHFERFGRGEGRAQALHCPGMSTRGRAEATMAPCDFNESTYLTLNPDIAAAVRRGAVVSGASHYLQFGAREGRLPNAGCKPAVAKCAFSESQYLKLNPDVARAVAMGQFATGAAHYARFGQSEGRAQSFECSGSSTRERSDLQYPACDFNETRYLAANPDVAQAVSSGEERSGLAHWQRTGRRERRAPYDRCD
ncbi:MAG: hypothetical protein Q8N23_33055 [Archangium sp.]|nr:hypothetical protein [Archangium sp.]MDP3157545.1 hypothetical protein [Archangium sp.]MDP3574309.1 hypothetical protein [Archangium sp.]